MFTEKHERQWLYALAQVTEYAQTALNADAQADSQVCGLFKETMAAKVFAAELYNRPAASAIVWNRFLRQS